MMTMKTVSVRQANHKLSDLLSRVERGEEILITKRNKPVVVLSPYRPPVMTPEREKAVQHAIDVMVQGPPWGGTLRRFRREEMRERLMISFDTNMLVYATASVPDEALRARDLHRPCNASKMAFLPLVYAMLAQSRRGTDRTAAKAMIVIYYSGIKDL
jgi:prevent-host-death family protein